MSGEDFTPIERRVLAYLDQRGPTHRSHIAADLARDGSRAAVHQNGSNGAVPLIVGKWCSRLVKRDFVRVVRHDGFYQHHEVTPTGRDALRLSSLVQAGGGAA